MSAYPFDSQKCNVTIINEGSTRNQVQLVVDSLKYKGPIDLLQYYIKETSFRRIYIDSDVGHGVLIEIQFGRRFLSHMLTTFAPTILICLTAFTTNYYAPNFFHAVVAVNLTALLVMSTMFIGVSNSLPKTFYVKMVDVWFLAMLSFPFVEVLLQTTIHWLVCKNQSKKSNFIKVGSVNLNLKTDKEIQTGKRLDRIIDFLEKVTDIGVIISFVVFMFGYFCIGFLVIK